MLDILKNNYISDFTHFECWINVLIFTILYISRVFTGDIYLRYTSIDPGGIVAPVYKYRSVTFNNSTLTFWHFTPRNGPQIRDCVPRKSRRKCLLSRQGKKTFSQLRHNGETTKGSWNLRGCATWHTIKLTRNGPRPCSTDGLFFPPFFPSFCFFL